MISLIIGFAINFYMPPVPEIEIRFQPSDVVYVYENFGANSSKKTYTSVIQNIAFISNAEEVSIENIDLVVYQNGKEVQKKIIYSAELIASAQKMKYLEENGYLELMDFQFQTSTYLKDVSLSSNTNLKDGQALVLSYQAFLFDSVPDSVLVIAHGISGTSKVTESKSLRIESYASQNSYTLPLKGRWVAATGPSLTGHHRWGSLQEFAFDFIQYGNGGLTHEGDGTHPSHYFSYDQEVFSIGKGEVVSVVNDESENAGMLKRIDEAEEAYMVRLMTIQMELLSKGLNHALGNHVIIRHENNEYSYYMHLRPGSVTVKVGDEINQGQQIGSVGNSGNSTEPHLHFHLANSGNITYSRSLPISFDNISLFPDDNGQIQHLHSGQVVISND